MNEQERQAELAKLIAEQAAEIDSHYQRPESQTVSFETMGEDAVGRSDTYFSGTEDECYSHGDEPNGVYSFLPPQKGEVLVEGASWHGTLYGARNKKCKCTRCRKAGRVYQDKLRQRARANKPA